MGDDQSEDSTKDTVFSADLQRVLKEEHKALREWLECTLGEHRRVLHEHTQSLQTLLALQGEPPSPRTIGGSSRRIQGVQRGRIHPMDSSSAMGSSVVLDLRRSTQGSVQSWVGEPLYEESSTIGSPGEFRGSTAARSSSRGKPGDVPNDSSSSPAATSSSPAAGSTCEWSAITPTATQTALPISAPTADPFALVDVGDAPEDFPHPLGVSHHPTSTSLTGSWTAVESEVASEGEADQDRMEWTRHLQRRVSEQLGGKHSKKLKRTGALVSSVGSASQGGPVERSRAKLQALLRGSVAQWVCAGVIVLNVAFIGYATDKGMKNVLAVPPQRDPDWFEAANTVFTVWYCVELLVRMCAFGWEFFKGQDRKWNLFDSVLVMLSLVEEVVQDVDVGIGALRVIRGLRMFRVLRIIRVMRYCRDLRLMVCSILQSLGSLSWSLLLLGTIMYLFSVVFMQGATMSLQNEAEDGTVTSGAVRDGVQTWYPSLAATMYTLLASIVDGVDWVSVVRPLEQLSMVYRGLFAFYVVFVVIGVLNVLTGIFVERACELSGLDKDLVIQSQIKRNEAFLVEMRQIFEEADADGSGTITWEEFKKYLEDDRVKAYLSTQQLDAYDARQLFDILTDGGSELTIEAFIVGCQRLRGIARSVDVIAVLEESRASNKRLKAMMRQLEGQGLLINPTPSLKLSSSGLFSHLTGDSA